MIFFSGGKFYRSGSAMSSSSEEEAGVGVKEGGASPAPTLAAYLKGEEGREGVCYKKGCCECSSSG